MRAMTAPDAPIELKGELPRGGEAVALALAVASVLLGFVAFLPVDLVAIGRPDPTAIAGPR